MPPVARLPTDRGCRARHLGSASSVLADLLGTALLGYGLVLAGLDAAWVAATAALVVAAGHRPTTGGIVATLSTSLVVSVLGWWQVRCPAHARLCAWLTADPGMTPAGAAFAPSRVQAVG